MENERFTLNGNKMKLTKFDDIMIGLILASLFSQFFNGINQLYLFTAAILGWFFPLLIWKLYETISHNKKIHI